jgi:multidrug efflux pump subunit AcrB
MNLSEPFIRRPIATSLLMLGVLVFGIVAYRLLPVSSLPNVDFPTITVTANLPGASPETMASAVATPLEQQFSAVNGLSEMTSLSGVGTTTITLQFDLSTDINAAAEDVQTAINAASGLLPKDLPTPPTYTKVNPNNFPVLIYAVHSDVVPDYELDRYVSDVLAQPLSMVPGVGGVFIFGQKKYAVRIEANPMALAAYHLGLEDVRTALANATVDLPKGEIVGPNRAISLDSNDQLMDAAPYHNIVIAYRNGAPVHLGDVATILNSEENTQVGAWYDGIPAEGLALSGRTVRMRSPSSRQSKPRCRAWSATSRRRSRST